MVTAAPRLRRRVAGAAAHAADGPRIALRAAAVLAVAFLLAAGLAGGLRRAGVELPIVHAAGAHAALMIGGFFAAVIGIERAVALHTRWAWVAPVASAAGGIALAFGAWTAGATLIAIGAAVFVAASVEVLRRQRAPHTVVLLLAALAGLGGALAWGQGAALGLPPDAAVAAWFAFLVLTIAAERLEMTRLMRRRPGARLAFGVIVAGLLSALVLTGADARSGGVVYGAGLLALAVWLGLFDIARITIATHGLSRYMAVALLAGYGWLGLAGAAWVATALGAPARDAALHALGLGFVFSMVMAHAPVILPAVAGVKLHFDRVFYAPLALLHASLALRLSLGAADPAARSWTALLNVAAIALFALTVLRAVRRWRQIHSEPSASP